MGKPLFFARGGALLVLALPVLLLAGCGGGGGAKTTSEPTAFVTSGPSDPVPTGTAKPVNITVQGGDLYAGGESNFVFGILNAKNQPVGGATAKVTFYDLSDRSKPRAVGTFDAVQSAPGVGPQTQHTHLDGEVHIHGGQDENRVVYYVPVSFPKAGFWGVVLDATLKDGTTGQSDAGFFVLEKPAYPAPGEKAHPSDNLTRADVSKISEIDSGDPPNDMHDVKIKSSIAAGRPVVVVFSTPAFCTSRFCGPVNEEVEYLHDKYRDTVDFVHIEIWSNFETKTFNPTAREWLLQPDGSLSEPWVFVIGKDGVIYDRWEGAAARNIIEPAVQAVSSGQTFATRPKSPVLK